MKRKYTTIQIETDQYKELKTFCIENGYTVAGFIKRLVKTQLDKNKKPLPSDRGLILPSVKSSGN
jgi:hypothetical protein